MKTVPLRGEKAAGRVAIVDDADYGLVIQRKWHVREYAIGRSGAGPYAETCIREPGIAPTTNTMHRLILPSAAIVDHVNGDGLDNRRSNLRPATASQNQWNRRKAPGCKSAYKGLSWHRQSGMWLVRITVNRRVICLGYFRDEIDGARAYDEAARHHYGEFARPNFPEAA